MAKDFEEIEEMLLDEFIQEQEKEDEDDQGNVADEDDAQEVLAEQSSIEGVDRELLAALQKQLEALSVQLEDLKKEIKGTKRAVSNLNRQWNAVSSQINDVEKNVKDSLKNTLETQAKAADVSLERLRNVTDKCIEYVESLVQASEKRSERLKRLDRWEHLRLWIRLLFGFVSVASFVFLLYAYLWG